MIAHRPNRPITALAALFATITLASCGGSTPAFKPIDGIFLRTSERFAGNYTGSLPADGFAPYRNEHVASVAEGTALEFVADLEVPRDAPTFALALGPGGYPRDVYVNGTLLKRTGDHLEGYSSTLYYTDVIDVDPAIAAPGSVARLSIVAYPRGETSPLGDLYSGTHRDAASYSFWRNFFNVNLIQASFLAAIILAIYFFFIYAAQGRIEPRNLEFALTCVMFALSYSNMTLYNDGADQVLLEKASRVGFPLTSLFLCFFARRSAGILQAGLGAKIRFWGTIVASVSAGALCVAVILAPDKNAVSSIFGAWGTSLLLPLLLVLTLAFFVAGLVRNRNVGSVAMLAGFLGTIGASVHDITYVNSGLVPYCYLVPYGYLALVLSIFFVLSLEQAKTARAIRRQGFLIGAKNRALGEMIEELSRVSAGLLGSNADMERTLSSTLDTVEHFGKDNEAITASVGGQIGEVERDIERISRSMAYSAERVPKAIENQTAAAEQVTKSLDLMGERIEQTLRSADASSRIASALAKSADESVRVIEESRVAIRRVSDFSKLLEDILKTIEDIAERTNVLSINAAIESAKFGAAGKGFAVVAQEIRNLANQSQASLATSFDRIKEMSGAIEASDALSQSVSDALARIIAESKRSSGETEKLRELVEGEREQSAQMLKSAAELVEQARSLKDIAELQTMSNMALDERLNEMRKSFGAIAAQLGEQAERRDAMFAALGHINEAVEGNSENIEALRASIEKAHAELSRSSEAIDDARKPRSGDDTAVEELAEA
jgi:methyl-accepting chemotaxis protein